MEIIIDIIATIADLIIIVGTIVVLIVYRKVKKKVDETKIVIDNFKREFKDIIDNFKENPIGKMLGM